MFDSGSVRTVSGHKGDLVEWKTNRKSTHQAYANFLIPALAWTSRSRTGKGETTAAPNTLWPLKVGNSANIQFKQVITKKDDSKPPATIDRNWFCKVENTARISVMAGTFDTYQIACSRNSSTSGRWRATRTYYYAPEIGHYVLREDQHKHKGNSRKELVSYGFNSNYLAKNDQKRLIQSLNRTLSRNKDGEASTWSSKSKKVTAMLVPTDSYRNPKGKSCREYQSIYNVNGRIGRPNTRTMCKSSNKSSWTRVN